MSKDKDKEPRTSTTLNSNGNSNNNLEKASFKDKSTNYGSDGSYSTTLNGNSGLAIAKDN